MYRVVTWVSDHGGRRQRENGPWLKRREDAEYWCSMLSERGYIVFLESLNDESGEALSDDALFAALSNMV